MYYTSIHIYIYIERERDILIGIYTIYYLIVLILFHFILAYLLSTYLFIYPAHLLAGGFANGLVEDDASERLCGRLFEWRSGANGFPEGFCFVCYEFNI